MQSWPRPYRLAASAAAVLLVLACAGRGRAAAPEAEDLRRGLVTVFQDDAKPPVRVVRLEPTVALASRPASRRIPRFSRTAARSPGADT